MGRAVRRGSWLGKPALTHLEVLWVGLGAWVGSNAVERGHIELQRVVLGEKGSPGRESRAGQGKTDEGLGLKVKPRRAEFSN